MKIKEKIIIGAGLYGLYAAFYSARKNKKEKILVLEYDKGAFTRATYANQARVHMGYHYPRSISTAERSAHYFQRFAEDFGFCLRTDFDQIYATSSKFSWTDAERFRRFCKNAGIRCEDVDPSRYFNAGMCDGAFLTEEYTYDACILKEYFLRVLAGCQNVEILYGQRIETIKKGQGYFTVCCADGHEYASSFLLNASYASTNQISRMVGYEPFKIKYELCEIILCQVSDDLKDVGLTVMDGPFFSIMPFGKTGHHSLTSVTFTPHMASYEDMPTFKCQTAVKESWCSPAHLANCNGCPARPESAWPYMSNLAKKYMKQGYVFSYSGSLFSMKPILRASEIDDSRPTVVRVSCTDPVYVSVLSGKIDTVYDLDEVLDHV